MEEEKIKQACQDLSIIVARLNLTTWPVQEKFNLGITLPWPNIGKKEIRHLVRTIRLNAEQIAKKHQLESFGQGPIVAAGGVLIVYLGFRLPN